MQTRRLLVMVAVALSVALLGACGGDDESGVAADSADAASPCSPVGEELAARDGRTVPVELKEYSFTPATLDVAEGVVTFAATNRGTLDHELAFLPGGGEVPLNRDGDPDEEALETAGAFELEAFGPGQTCNATYDLDPGTYTVFCIVTDDDGQTHLQKGMRGRLTVA
jgi:plastocyanin